VAHLFIIDGPPTNEDLALIFANAAPRMRFMRERLGQNPDNCESTCLTDVLDNWRAMYREGGKEKKQFRNWFPKFRKRYIMQWSRVGGALSRNKNTLPQLRESVEKCLRQDERCAISIYLNEHYVTGCFDTVVGLHVVM
jgi:hypothetical protein